MSKLVYTVTMFEDEDWNEWAGVEVFNNIRSAALRAWAHEGNCFTIIGKPFEDKASEYISTASDTYGYLGGQFFTMRPEVVSW